MKYSYRLNNTRLLISRPVSIKQVQITNPTTRPVYVNIGTQFPTTTKFDFLINANSIFTSPLFATNNLAITTPSIDASGYAEIIVSDEKIGEPVSNSFTPPQYTGILSGYPYTIKSGDIAIGGQKDLPPIPYDTYSFIAMSITTVTLPPVNICPMKIIFRPSQFTDGYHQFGTKAINANKIFVIPNVAYPGTIIPRVFGHPNHSWDTDRVFSVFQVPNPIDIDNTGQHEEIVGFLNETRSVDYVYAFETPGFMYGLRGDTLGAAGVQNITITSEIIHHYQAVQTIYETTTKIYATMPANSTFYVIKPRINLISACSFITCHITVTCTGLFNIGVSMTQL